MRRTKKASQSKPSAILTADWHLRETVPVCRTDNFWQTQWDKVDQIRRLQVKYNCPVIHAGDLFDHWKPSPHLLSKAFLCLPERFWTIYGNHDLPQHNLSLYHKSGVYTLASGFKIHVLKSAHWGQNPRQNPDDYVVEIEGTKILVWHVMTYLGQPPWPGCDAMTADRILKVLPQFDLIVTGDNHKSFVVEKKGRWLVNPGSLTRQTAAQADHRPCVYLWYANERKAKPHYLDVQDGVVSNTHLVETEERNARIEAFLERLDRDWEVGLDFNRNLEVFLKKNRIRKPVRELVWKAVDGED